MAWLPNAGVCEALMPVLMELTVYCDIIILGAGTQFTVLP